jgi:hypothetical protein
MPKIRLPSFGMVLRGEFFYLERSFLKSLYNILHEIINNIGRLLSAMIFSDFIHTKFSYLF